MKKIFKNQFVFFAILMGVVLMSSCVNQQKLRLLQDTSGITNSFENSKKTTYIIQTGDHLYIRIYSLDPKTSKFFQTDLPALMNPTFLYLNSYVVDEQGYVSFSFIDKMFVRGLTIEEAHNLLQKTISEYFKEATVVVRLVNFEVAILGEVHSPGTFTIDKDQINIFQAIGLAGGFNEFSNIKKVKLVRQTLKGSDIFILDLSNKDILKSDYFYLMPSDILYIEPRTAKSFAFEKFPYGEIFSTVSLAISLYLLLRK
jgi:polysaccharide biosynthesis/export protein